ncbi:MAG: adenylosuccinate lyase, partial [Nitrososphaeria archaeon]|nr:adenylosuccinate lyase [Nitrososphaeria archaeon]NIN52987.1 adenylosuccinate lyase [Nitrososphaeria archaeon]NIQ33546.1 adenylosuccinate lyase [Nitrososphaeria archaeon]
RVIIPEGFLATDECLRLYDKIMRDVAVYPAMIKQNLERYSPFSGTEAVLIRLVERGEDRQAMHERLREHSFRAWEKVSLGEENPLLDLLKGDTLITSRLSSQEIDELMDPSGHVGDASERCVNFMEEIVKPILSKYRDRVGKRVEVEF